MSRIGNKPITLPSGVSVDVAAGAVTVKGPKGELTQEIDPDFKVTVEDGVMSIVRPTDQKKTQVFAWFVQSFAKQHGCGS